MVRNMAKQQRTERRFFLLKCGLVAASLAGVGMFTGCGDGPGSGSGSMQMEAQISGKVADVHGPVNDGKLEVKDASGAAVASTQVSDGRYQISVPASASYPILLVATPSSGISTDPVKAVVTSPIADRMDISAVTTDIVNNAIALGGLTAENIAKASGGAIGMRQAQGVSAGAGGSGGGPGNSGGGTGRGGHGGHNMDAMGGRPTGSDSSGDTPHDMNNMQK